MLHQRLVIDLLGEIRIRGAIRIHQGYSLQTLLNLVKRVNQVIVLMIVIAGIMEGGIMLTLATGLGTRNRVGMTYLSVIVVAALILTLVEAQLQPKPQTFLWIKCMPKMPACERKIKIFYECLTPVLEEQIQTPGLIRKCRAFVYH
ncbi:hypothetical protein DdX_17434 [Ditylenchus destructor]|uniref:Uncharacterized protein n=1 Tax=Ditylenchus destructor TaxID=166010 RepID=A0AAD4MM58_9BILA|nr:hypothetical protein DdX_17434 [Ditylenchus destructor]